LPLLDTAAGDAAWLRQQQAAHGNLHDVVRQASERLMPTPTEKSWENPR